MKLVNDVLEKIKGEKSIKDTICGKGAFSNQNFENLTNALFNDTTYNAISLDKKGETVETNVSKIVRDMLKKTATNAKYPQKSEIDVYDTCDINTNDITKVMQVAVNEWIRCGKKFDLPSQQDMNGSVYLAKVPAKEKVVKVRSIKTKEDLGTTTINTKEYVQVRTKSPAPKHLQTKVRRDLNGKIVK